MHKKILKCSVFLLVVTVSPAVLAGTYEWVDEKGITHFSNEPPVGQEGATGEPQNKIDKNKDAQPPLDEATALKEAEATFKSKDYVKAFTLLKPLAERGNPRAQNGLGIMYGQGLIGPKDLNEAFKWHQKAAEQGYALGQYYLGLMYADGDGVPKNAVEGAKWLRRAADQGVANAQFSLGVMYETGEGGILAGARS